jgi:Uma2 family endonuclease
MDGKDAMPTSARSDVRLTYDDFLRFPDDGKRHEIIDGVHYVTPSPGRRHQQLLGRLHLAIAEHLRAHPSQGEVYFAPFDVIFSHWDIVEPDLLLVAGDQLGILTEKNVVGAPALVVEILSPGTRKRDVHLKRRLFERDGVREYWLVDPTRNVVSVFRRADTGAFAPAVEYHASERATLTTSILPGWSLTIDQLFV